MHGMYLQGHISDLICSEIMPWWYTCKTTITPPNYKGDSAKIASSARSNTMQIFGDNVSPPYRHVHARKMSSPILAHTKTQIPLDTKHTSPKKMSSAHCQYAVPIKSNTIYVFARPCMW